MGLLEDGDISVACICETWLYSYNSSITATIKSYGYSILHDFRSEKRGGGVAIIYKSTLSVRENKLVFKPTTFEVIVGTIKTSNCKISVITIYRTGPVSSVFVQELNTMLCEVCEASDNVLLGGDFNIHFNNHSDRLSKEILEVT